MTFWARRRSRIRIRHHTGKHSHRCCIHKMVRLRCQILQVLQTLQVCRHWLCCLRAAHEQESTCKSDQRLVACGDWRQFGEVSALSLRRTARGAPSARSRCAVQLSVRSSTLDNRICCCCEDSLPYLWRSNRVGVGWKSCVRLHALRSTTRIECKHYSARGREGWEAHIKHHDVTKPARERGGMIFEQSRQGMIEHGTSRQSRRIATLSLF